MQTTQAYKLQFAIDCTPNQCQHTLVQLEQSGLTPITFPANGSKILGVVLNRDDPRLAWLGKLPGVSNVIPVYHEFALGSNNFATDPTVVVVGKVRIGGGSLVMIAGPCAVEGYESLDTIAGQVKAAGANLLRGGAFKPRTNPYAFQGLGEDGLKILKDVGEKHGLPVVTEVMDPRQVELVHRYADMFQIGARNMQNFDLLKEVGQTKKPVLLKRGMSATVKDLLTSAEYVLAGGNPNVVLCERGVRSFDDSTRNMLDLSAVPNVKGQSHLPIIVDPSHATGRPDLIPSMARAAVACGADGIHVEVHHDPDRAFCDGKQALRPAQYAAMMANLHALATFCGKTID
jgi:3-deoxy-7-phosphoheptulonate synthase